ncbi:protein DA1-related 1-like isoform X3 [Quercus lobata]|uniref:protein DA1-related 1-like isoform X3 n=1 Tax=Quercus lobata TaxID=97700 RepID=UPI0012452C14|nr:protein DA1-related 1-like isoform X3 [Quercus lobata]
MKDFKGSSHRGQYHGNYADERIWDGACSSVDEWTVIEKEDLECAVAMSLSEQDQKGKNVIDDDSQSEDDEHVSKVQLVEDEQLAKALQESYPLEEDEQLAKTLQESYPLVEDEQLAKALQESYPLEEDIQLVIENYPSEEDEQIVIESYPFEEDEQLVIENYPLVIENYPLEEDEQLVIENYPLEDDEQLVIESYLSEEDEQLVNALHESYPLEEYEQLAKALQESYPLEEDEQLVKAVHESYPLEEDEQLAKALQESYPLAEDEQFAKALQESYPLEEDELLAKALHESLLESPPRYGICAGCNTEISHGKILCRMDAIWHAECFRCHACNLPIKDHEFSTSGKHRFHKSCHKKQHSPICDVCKNFIPKNSAGLIECRKRPFWEQQFCPSHEHDRTPLCCSCERMETRDRKYLLLDDGRKLCLECLDSAVMDTNECQPLYIEIKNFFEGLHMKVEQEIPMLLVERQALNVAMDGEKNGHHHMRETRGLCLSEEQTVTTISRRPKMVDNQIIDLKTEPRRLIRRCEVTAILVLYGLPRLLTGSILAHEMMHAWLRLKGYPNLSPKVEEGICQVLAHMWMESEILSASGSDVASSSSSSSPSSSSSSKKGKRSEFEKKLGEFFKHQIETDTSSAYGDGFREGNEAVLKYDLKTTLKHIQMTKNFPG